MTRATVEAGTRVKLLFGNSTRLKHTTMMEGLLPEDEES